MELSYQSYGDRDAPVLVLLMGLGMPAAAWPQEFISLLVQGGLHVICPDNRDSRLELRIPVAVSRLSLITSIFSYLLHLPVHGPYRLEDMAADVVRLLDKLQIERAHIAGISMGGMIAQAFACHHPQRTISLSCLSTASGNPRTGLGSWRAIREILQPVSPTATPQEVLARTKAIFRAIGTVNGGYTDAYLQNMMAALSSVPRCYDGAARQILAILSSGNRVKQLRQLQVPTVVIHGTADPLLPFAAGQELAHVIPQARFFPIADMGHDLAPVNLEKIARPVIEQCRAHG